jgi:hypothetical protein
MASLKPGERKILKALEEEEKKFKDLNKRGILVNPNILSAYLKNLQKQGLITRDIDERKFRLNPHGWETLYLAEIRDLIEEQGLEKAHMKLWGLDVIISEDTNVIKLMDKTLMSGVPYASKVRYSFSKINKFLFRIWKEHVLTFFSEKEQEIITHYEHALEEAAWFITPLKERVSEESTKSRAVKKLKQQYPGVTIPKKMIQLEAEKITKKLEALNKRTLLLEIGNVETLKKRLQNAHHLAMEVQAKLTPLKQYLEDPKNTSIYKRYIKRLRKCPKTLLIFSSTGFSDYLSKYWQFFTDKEEEFKKKHPWLYTKIKESSD